MRSRSAAPLVGLILALTTLCIRAQVPALPEGLGPQQPPQDASSASSGTRGTATAQPVEPGGPALPPGLGSGDAEPPSGRPAAPQLPQGLGMPQPTAEPAAPQPRGDRLARYLRDELGLTGFWDTRVGVRTRSDPYEKEFTLGETRLQLDWERAWDGVIANVTADLVYDPVLDRYATDLERGYGWLDLRQANLSATPFPFMDVKVGRQILTWGTGDLVFINDLFPKDWQSFFIGRDVEYLKAPSDALKVSLFSGLANVDVVYTPAFDADRFISGRRLSYFNPMLGRRAGRDAIIHVDRPEEWFEDDELALRLSRNLQGVELAAYGYIGRWKSPGGFEPVTGRSTFPRLNVWGGSVRGQWLGGIANAEAGYYDSRQDRDGDDAFVPNSQLRFLVGYERDLPRLARDFGIGVQWVLEHMLDHGAYQRALSPAQEPFSADENRHLLTLRLTKQALNQTLELSFFGYYSPTDDDGYIRPRISYKIDDHWTVEGGGNVFFGEQAHTFFNQFALNSNVYAALRYGF